MSFTKTISTVAALASIFGAAAAGWKLAESNSQQPPTALDEKLNQLDKKLEDISKSPPVVIPNTNQVLTPAPQPTILPPVTPPPTPPTAPEPPSL